MDEDLQNALYLSELEAALQASLQEQNSTKPMTTEELAFFTDEPLPRGREDKETKTKQEKEKEKEKEKGAKRERETERIAANNSSSKPSAREKAPAEAKRNTSASSAPSLPGNSNNSRPGNSSNSNNNSNNKSNSRSPSDRTICSFCGLSLTNAGKYLQCEDFQCHERCFLCAACGAAMDPQSFTIRGEAGERLPYHPRCAVELFHPRCCLCNCAVNGRYMRHPFFEEEIYCVGHTDRDDCFSCGRKEPLKSSSREQFTMLSDGRKLCPHCAVSVIMDSREAADLYAEIVNFFEFHLHLPIPAGMRSVPVLVVDLPSINEYDQKETQARSGTQTHASGARQAITRGRTLSTKGEIRHFVRSPFSQFSQEVFHIEEVRDVTAVLVLFGLPRDLFASILAHEAMHVWCKLSKSLPFSMRPKVEEGLCQLIAFKFLEFLSTQESSPSPSDEKQRLLFRNQIETDPSPVYGDGFREAIRAEHELSLPILLEVLENNGGADFPQV